jgi:acetoacetyl-CoA reductase
MVDRVAFVTGGMGGIGTAICKRLAANGNTVVANCLPGYEKKDEWLGSMRAQGFSVHAAEGNVEEFDSCADMFYRISSIIGPVDILVNNAGLTRDNILLRLSEADWDAVLDANLKGAFLTTRMVIKGMMKRRFGRIINIGSIVGLTGNKGQANYAASKAGLIGFTKSVAKEYASRNVLVNCVAPGFIETDMTSGLPPEARAALLQEIALERLGRAEDVAGAVLFLASDLAGYITGQVLVVDGGMVI